MYTEEIITIVLCWIFYYLIIFTEIAVGVFISLKIIESRSSLSLDKRKRLSVLRNMLISFLVGYIVALIFAVIKECNLILIVLFIFSLAVGFPFGHRDSFTVALIIGFISGMMIFSIFLNYRLFSKKTGYTKKKSIISAFFDCCYVVTVFFICVFREHKYLSKRAGFSCLLLIMVSFNVILFM